MLRRCLPVARASLRGIHLVGRRASKFQYIQSQSPSLVSLQKLPFSSAADSDGFNFERDSEETLESLSERFEELLQEAPDMQDSDVSLASGVLTVELPDHGTYVINKQSPNRQIWLSSPISGPARFDFDEDKRAWMYSRTGKSLHETLDEEIGKEVLKVESGFETDCYMGGKGQ